MCLRIETDTQTSFGQTSSSLWASLQPLTDQSSLILHLILEVLRLVFTFLSDDSPSAIHSTSFHFCLNLSSHGLHSVSHVPLSFWYPHQHSFLYSYSFPSSPPVLATAFVLVTVCTFARDNQCCCFFPFISLCNLGVWLDNWDSDVLIEQTILLKRQLEQVSSNEWRTLDVSDAGKQIWAANRNQLFVCSHFCHWTLCQASLKVLLIQMFAKISSVKLWPHHSQYV